VHQIIPRANTLICALPYHAAHGIANMLGVRREGVTEAAGKLQRLNVIHYARGKITVLDRPKLEQRCCECYAVVKKETDRLLPIRANS